MGDAPSKCSPTWHSPKWTVEWTASCIQSDVGTPKLRHQPNSSATTSRKLFPLEARWPAGPKGGGQGAEGGMEVGWGNQFFGSLLQALFARVKSVFRVTSWA